MFVHQLKELLNVTPQTVIKRVYCCQPTLFPFFFFFAKSNRFRMSDSLICLIYSCVHHFDCITSHLWLLFFFQVSTVHLSPLKWPCDKAQMSICLFAFFVGYKWKSVKQNAICRCAPLQTARWDLMRRQPIIVVYSFVFFSSCLHTKAPTVLSILHSTALPLHPFFFYLWWNISLLVSSSHFSSYSANFTVQPLLSAITSFKMSSDDSLLHYYSHPLLYHSYSSICLESRQDRNVGWQ